MIEASAAQGEHFCAAGSKPREDRAIEHIVHKRAYGRGPCCEQRAFLGQANFEIAHPVRRAFRRIGLIQKAPIICLGAENRHVHGCASLCPPP
jgi:hypothetical protein